MAKHRPGAPLLSRAELENSIHRLNATFWPLLATLAVITGTMSGIGIAHQAETPTLESYMTGAVFGFAVWIVSQGFWAGAWLLPLYTTRMVLGLFLFVAFYGCVMLGTVSVFSNQKFLSAEISEGLSQSDEIDEIATARQSAGAYFRQLDPIQAGLVQQQAGHAVLATQENDGTGPTGQRGTGPVYNTYLTASGQYQKAARLVKDQLAKANRIDAQIADTLVALREVQADPALTAGERRTKLRILKATAFDHLRRMVDIDPGATVRAAAALIAQGVPQQSNARATSQARIAEIRADMISEARRLERQAEELAAQTVDLPKPKTNSQAQDLISNFLRLPGLTMAAFAFDFVGWVFIGFRTVAYAALRKRDETEIDRNYDVYITPQDIERIEMFNDRMLEARERLVDPTALPKPTDTHRNGTGEDGGQANA